MTLPPHDNTPRPGRWACWGASFAMHRLDVVDEVVEAGCGTRVEASALVVVLDTCGSVPCKRCEAAPVRAQLQLPMAGGRAA